MVDVGSLVTVMESTLPDILMALRARYPGATRLLSTGRDLGAPEVGSYEGLTDTLVAASAQPAMLDLAKAGVEAMRKRVDALLAHILNRMKLASRIKLAGAIVASASGLVTAFLAFAGQPKGYTELATAAFSFFGGLVTILADQVVRSPSGLLIASTEEHGKILAMRLEVERMALRLAREAITPLTQDDLVKVLDRLDEQAVEIIRYQGT